MTENVTSENPPEFNRSTDAHAVLASFIYRYHHLTKHTVEKLMASGYGLDWKNQPDPFRKYSGAELIPLDREFIQSESDYFSVLHELLSQAQAASGHAGESRSHNLSDVSILSNLLFYTCSISAWKAIKGTDDKWALRCNASSGNLHPTETHLLVHELNGLAPGAYHYLVSEHSLEKRSAGTQAVALWQLAGGNAGNCPPLVLVFTSILWREVWKYRERGFRYCQHDLGHALGSLLLASASLGWEADVHAVFADAQTAELLGLDGTDEVPYAIIGLRPTTRALDDTAHSEQTSAPGKFAGTPNELSKKQITYEIVN
ncbi:MAG: SagB/ThcOx family dehydrogenase, partial [Terriglobales bacterium]